MITTLMDSRGERTSTNGDIDTAKDKPGYNHDLESACSSLMSAVERKSLPDIMDAFQACFQACESAPHDEAEPEDEST